MSTFHSVLLRFLKLLFKLTYFFSLISYLTGNSAACLLPGLLCGIEGLNQPILGAAVLLEPATLCGIMGCKWSLRRLAPLAILDRMTILGGSSIGTSTMRTLLGHALSCFRGCSNLGLVGPGFLIVFLEEQFLDLLEVH